MMTILKRYKVFLLLAVLNVSLILVNPKLGSRSIQLSSDNFREMFIVVPPIFVLLGLLDAWVPREMVIKLMGEKSGLFGIALAFVLGSFAAGPLYAAFPVAGALLRKGSKFSNILIFIGAWSTTKVPMLLFEASSMGWRFMATRFMLDIPGIIIIAYIIEHVATYQEKVLIYDKKLSL
jgi:uncharacterized membrane protein YraQ (UPF0718 family)